MAWSESEWSSSSGSSSTTSSASWSGSSSSCPTSITSDTRHSGFPSTYLEISQWSDSEDEEDDEAHEDLFDWDASSIITDEIELETAEQLFVSFMASMADLLNPSTLAATSLGHGTVPDPILLAPSRPLSYSHPQPPPRAITSTSASAFGSSSAPDHLDPDDEWAPPRPLKALPHSASMPPPATEPPPWHQPRGNTPEPCRKSRCDGGDVRFSVALARMGDWEARNAAAVTHAVYRRHAGIDEDAQPWCEGESWQAAHELRQQRHGMVGTGTRLGLGVAYTDDGHEVPPAAVSVIGRGIAYSADSPSKSEKKGIMSLFSIRLRRNGNRA